MNRPEMRFRLTAAGWFVVVRALLEASLLVFWIAQGNLYIDRRSWPLFGLAAMMTFGMVYVLKRSVDSLWAS